MAEAIFVKNKDSFLRRINTRSRHLGFLRTTMDRALDIQMDNIIKGTLQGQRKIKSKGSGPFAPLSPQYEARKRRQFPGAPILKATGVMLSTKSFLKKIFSMGAQTVGRLIYVGPPRGPAHQKGVRKKRGKFKARPWYGFRTGDPRRIFRSIGAGVANIMRRLRQ